MHPGVAPPRRLHQDAQVGETSNDHAVLKKMEGRAFVASGGRAKEKE